MTRPGDRTKQASPHTDRHVPTSTSQPRRSTRINLTQEDRLRLDARYHPMDETLRRSNAAKLKSMHGIIDANEASDHDSDVTIVDGVEDDEDDNDDNDESGEEDVEHIQKGIGTSSTIRSAGKARRASSRIARQTTPVSYNQKHHPQDALLRSAGIIRGVARHRLSTSDTDAKPDRKRSDTNSRKVQKARLVNYTSFPETLADREIGGRSRSWRKL